jgi:hypothetical protein
MMSEPAGRNLRRDGENFPARAERPYSRIVDDDGRDDEHANENEAPVGAVDEQTETPEEFSIDDDGTRDHRDPPDGIDEQRSSRR